MATFRVKDLIVAVARGQGAVRADGGADEPGVHPGDECAGTGCLAATQAIYACLKGPSVIIECATSDPATRMIVGPCYGPSVIINCGTSDPATRRVIEACHHPSAVVTCATSDPATRRARVESMPADELAVLKRQLSEAMEHVGRHEERRRLADESAARVPETPDEIALLKEKLAQALQELERRGAGEGAKSTRRSGRRTRR
jgi:hypothetical protein